MSKFRHETTIDDRDLKKRDGWNFCCGVVLGAVVAIVAVAMLLVYMVH